MSRGETSTYNEPERRTVGSVFAIFRRVAYDAPRGRPGCARIRSYRPTNTYQACILEGASALVMTEWEPL